MFAKCCCSGSKDRWQLNISTGDSGQVPSTLSEEVGAYGHFETDVETATTRVGLSPDVAARTTTSSQTQPLELATDMPVTQEEKEAEKTRIQEMVNIFARKAVRGCSCVFINESSGVHSTTNYRIDKGLEYLIVMSEDDKNKAELTCPIARIRDIFSVAEDGETYFPLRVLSTLQLNEMELLLMVVYSGNQDQLFRFCVLENSCESRDIFVECLRILCVYAQQVATSNGQV